MLEKVYISHEEMGTFQMHGDCWIRTKIIAFYTQFLIGDAYLDVTVFCDCLIPFSYFILFIKNYEAYFNWQWLMWIDRWKVFCFLIFSLIGDF